MINSYKNRKISAGLNPTSLPAPPQLHWDFLPGEKLPVSKQHPHVWERRRRRQVDLKGEDSRGHRRTRRMLTGVCPVLCSDWPPGLRLPITTASQTRVQQWSRHHNEKILKSPGAAWMNKYISPQCKRKNFSFTVILKLHEIHEIIPVYETAAFAQSQGGRERTCVSLEDQPQNHVTQSQRYSEIPSTQGSQESGFYNLPHTILNFFPSPFFYSILYPFSVL